MDRARAEEDVGLREGDGLGLGEGKEICGAGERSSHAIPVPAAPTPTSPASPIRTDRRERPLGDGSAGSSVNKACSAEAVGMDNAEGLDKLTTSVMGIG